MGIYNEKRSFNIRLWHWLSAIAVFGLVFTYILRKTVLNYKTNAEIIQVKLSEIGVLIADDKAKEIAKIFRDNMWQWHYYLGFFFIGLLAFRLYAFATKRDKFPSCKAKEAPSKEFAAVKYTHAFFYVVALYMAFSGLAMYYREALGISKESLSLVKELHELAFWFFAVFIVAHIAGVVKAEVSSDKGLISEMFSGGDEK